MSLEEIARLAGVSRATVSRVINNHPYVSDDVRQRVKQVIEREGFQPNAAGRMLARQRTEVIGVISPEGLEQFFSDPYFPLMLSGITTAITQSDYAMSLWVGFTPEETEHIYRRILGYKLMDGALILSVVDGDTLPQRLLERKVPMVMIGRPPLPEVSTVDVDNQAAARTAVEHLIRLGRRRIAHVSGRLDMIAARERLQGYRAALESARLPFDPLLVVEGEFNERSGYMAGNVLAGRNIDAVFVGNDTMALGVMNAFRERQIAIPKDVAIIGFDDLPFSATSHPSLTTIRQPIREAGLVATRLLLSIIDDKMTTPQRIILPTELVIRESCGTLGNTS